MARTANIMTRVDPAIKEQAENVLAQLGISMSSAMEIFLRQVALQQKIPFEIKLPVPAPTALSSLNDAQFNALMDKAARTYAAGECATIEDFETVLHAKNVL